MTGKRLNHRLIGVRGGGGNEVKLKYKAFTLSFDKLDQTLTPVQPSVLFVHRFFFYLKNPINILRPWSAIPTRSVKG